MTSVQGGPLHQEAPGRRQLLSHVESSCLRPVSCSLAFQAHGLPVFGTPVHLLVLLATPFSGLSTPTPKSFTVPLTPYIPHHTALPPKYTLNQLPPTTSAKGDQGLAPLQSPSRHLAPTRQTSLLYPPQGLCTCCVASPYTFLRCCQGQCLPFQVSAPVCRLQEA